MFIQKKRIVADEEVDEELVDNIGDEEVDVDVDVDVEDPDVVVEPEATELLFETEDVAELVAEITGLPVEVAAEEDSVVFTVGEDEFTVEPEGDEEVLEACKAKAKKEVKANTNRKAVKASVVRTPAKAARPVVVKTPKDKK